MSVSMPKATLQDFQSFLFSGSVANFSYLFHVIVGKTIGKNVNEILNMSISKELVTLKPCI